MPSELFNLTINENIAHLQFARPDEYNTMTRAFWHEFPRIIDEINHAASARVLVISSTGKHFSAGMDLAVFTDEKNNREEKTSSDTSQSKQPQRGMFDGEAGRRQELMRHRVQQLQACFSLLETCRIPVLAAIQGGCIGGAVDLVTACDSRYCTTDAFFTVKETALGMTADLGTLQRLPKLIAPGLARELCYTARRFNATEALNAGLVNQVFETAEQLLDGVMDIAKQIAQHSPLAITGTKEMINYSRDHSLQESLNYMALWQAGMFQPTDMSEVFTAKFENREQQFEDLYPLPDKI